MTDHDRRQCVFEKRVASASMSSTSVNGNGREIDAKGGQIRYSSTGTSETDIAVLALSVCLFCPADWLLAGWLAVWQTTKTQDAAGS